ncbi:MAG: hypothetical protein V3R64_07445 [Sphingomonadales bacterium]
MADNVNKAFEIYRANKGKFFVGLLSIIVPFLATSQTLFKEVLDDWVNQCLVVIELEEISTLPQAEALI